MPFGGANLAAFLTTIQADSCLLGRARYLTDLPPTTRRRNAIIIAVNLDYPDSPF